MNQKSQEFFKYAKLFGAVCGGVLMSLPAIPQQALAQLNPNPSIFSEPPYNRSAAPASPGAGPSRPVPPDATQGEPTPPAPGVRPPRRVRPARPVRPDATQGAPVAPPDATQGEPVAPPPDATPPGSNPESPNKQLKLSQQLPPEPRQAPIATIAPTNGRVDVRLINNSGAPVTYQVIGDTQERTLQGKSSILLQGLRTPATVTLYREDRGLLQVTPQKTSEPGILEVTLQETTNFSNDGTALRIGENGGVYLN